jgi:hypothetical protein
MKKTSLFYKPKSLSDHLFYLYFQDVAYEDGFVYSIGGHITFVALVGKQKLIKTVTKVRKLIEKRVMFLCTQIYD